MIFRFTAAVQHAGLADALRGGTLTVFAPNGRFKASGFADAAAITALPAATVNIRLQYHVWVARSSLANRGGYQHAVPRGGMNVYVPSLLLSGVSVNKRVLQG